MLLSLMQVKHQTALEKENGVLRQQVSIVIHVNDVHKQTHIHNAHTRAHRTPSYMAK